MQRKSKVSYTMYHSLNGDMVHVEVSATIAVDRQDTLTLSNMQVTKPDGDLVCLDTFGDFELTNMRARLMYQPNVPARV